MEGEQAKSKSCCSTPAQSCGVNKKAYCKCGPGWMCEIRKIEDPEEDTKPFYKCTEGCVCEEGSGTRVEVEGEDGAHCVCGEGYACKITKTEGSDAGKVLCECGNGFSCEIIPSGSASSGHKVVFKDA